MSNALEEYKQIISQTKEKSPIFIKAAATNHTDVLSSSVLYVEQVQHVRPSWVFVFWQILKRGIWFYPKHKAVHFEDSVSKKQKQFKLSMCMWKPYIYCRIAGTETNAFIQLHCNSNDWRFNRIFSVWVTFIRQRWYHLYLKH